MKKYWKYEIIKIKLQKITKNVKKNHKKIQMEKLAHNRENVKKEPPIKQSKIYRIIENGRKCQKISENALKSNIEWIFTLGTTSSAGSASSINIWCELDWKRIYSASNRGQLCNLYPLKFKCTTETSSLKNPIASNSIGFIWHTIYVHVLCGWEWKRPAGAEKKRSNRQHFCIECHCDSLGDIRVKRNRFYSLCAFNLKCNEQSTWLILLLLSPAITCWQRIFFASLSHHGTQCQPTLNQFQRSNSHQ